MKRAGSWWWVLYGASAIAVAAAMGVVTGLVLEMERESFALRIDDDRQATLRLVLWRMDSWLAPRLGREAARPHSEYTPFFSNQATYTRYLSEIPPGDVVVPSPLLSFESEYIPIHFQLCSDGTVTSPQIPQGNELDLWQSKMSEAPESSKSDLLDRVRTLVAQKDVAAACRIQETFLTSQIEVVTASTDRFAQSPDESEGDTQALANIAEYERRSQTLQSAQQTESTGQAAANVFATPDEAEVRVGPLVPIWITGAVAHPGGASGPELLFVRRVEQDGAEVFQGFLANWPRIRAALLEQAADLAPEIEMIPVLDPVPDAARASWMLATIPAEIRGDHRLDDTSPPAFSAARLTLGLAWFGVLVGIIAAGLTLRSVIDFGRRRSRFASAVTHELRTPLTTFQMYSEMLAEDMVTDPAQRRAYHETLREESTRLSSLVENVLAFARVEDGRATSRLESVTLRELLARHLPAIERRIGKAGASLFVEADAPESAKFSIDVESVGQILFNLADNACKYGCDGPDRRLDISARLADRRLICRVRDHGHGVAPDVSRRIFEPFDRGAIEPGAATPGVGLGLALSRELASSMGGTLTLCPPPPDGGACFELSVPVL